MSKLIASASFVGISVLASFAHAAPTSVDGSIGAEWSAVTPKVATYDAAAPLGNFGAPGSTNHVAAYDIYVRSDADYIYVGLDADDAVDVSGVSFANLYFGLENATGFVGSVGFEVLNERAFRPGLPGYYPYTSAGSDIHFATGTGVIEFAAPISFFTDDPLSAGFVEATKSVRLSLSQSFGYSVVGGNGYGVPDRLGRVIIPEPASLGALAAVGMLALRRRVK